VVSGERARSGLEPPPVDDANFVAVFQVRTYTGKVGLDLDSVTFQFRAARFRRASTVGAC